MQSRLTERLFPLLGLVLAAGAVPAALLIAFGYGMVMVPMVAHFVVVGLAAIVALGASLALTIVGARRSDGRAVLVGTAFAAMGSMLLVHALATPTILIGSNGLVQLAGAGNLPVGAAVLGLAAWPALRRPASVKPLLWLQGSLLAVIAIVGAVGLLHPAAIPIVPGPGGFLAESVLVLAVVLLSLLVYRAGKTFLLTRRTGDLAVVVGVVWLGCAAAGLLLLGYMDLGFWIAHGLEVSGLALIGVPVAIDLHRGSQSFPLSGDLSAVQLVSAEEEFFGPRIRALMVRLAEKDEYTEHHTRRVALLAVRIGETLHLPPARLRTLAIGSLLHDMGKLSVPNAVLQKPGPLTDDEFAVIRRHTLWGDELLSELGGFSSDVHRVVVDHHERLDGKGYPHALEADAIDLSTRIMTVCDVYDALISNRVYRAAWPQERALALLHEETGTAFDADCVAALERVLETDREQDASALSAAA